MWQKIKNALKYKRDQVAAPRRAFAQAAGSFVDENSAMAVAAYHRGVIYISSQIAKLPWDVKSEKNEKVFDNIYYMLNLRPNPEMNSMMFRLCMIQNAINHGNAFAEIERDIIGRPKSLWPIPSQSVELYRTPENTLVYRVIGGSLNGQDVWLPLNDVFHIRNFHTKDGLVGQGLIAYAANTLGISLGGDKMASSLFANGGLPSGVLEVEGRLQDEAFKKIKESWDENHKGRKAGGVAILEEGVKYKPISMSPDILQFLESRKFSVLDIARFLGLPPTKLFDTDAATFNNQENSNLEVATDTLDAWARQFEIEADTKILSNQFGGKYTELDLYQVFRGDMTTRANYFSKMMQAAAITPNQIREREGLAGYSGGDRYFLAVNNYSPMDRVDELIDSQIEKNQGGQDPVNSSSKDTNGDSQELTKAAITFLTRK
jgi:HK97 family phage portal protein